MNGPVQPTEFHPESLFPNLTDKQKAALADPLTALRLRLLANGYTPLPNYDKVCREPNWPRLVVNAAAILSWKGSRA